MRWRPIDVKRSACKRLARDRQKPGDQYPEPRQPGPRVSGQDEFGRFRQFPDEQGRNQAQNQSCQEKDYRHISETSGAVCAVAGGTVEKLHEPFQAKGAEQEVKSDERRSSNATQIKRSNKQPQPDSSGHQDQNRERAHSRKKPGVEGADLLLAAKAKNMILPPQSVTIKSERVVCVFKCASPSL